MSDTPEVAPPSKAALAADEKICPVCAETIKAAAIKCRFCGADVGGPPRQGAASAPAVPAERGHDWRVVVVLVMVALVAGVFLLGYLTDPKDMQQAEDARAVKKCRSDPTLSAYARDVGCFELEKLHIQKYGRLP